MIVNCTPFTSKMPAILAVQRSDSIISASDGRGIVTFQKCMISPVPGTILFEYKVTGECKLLGVIYEASGYEVQYWPLTFGVDGRGSMHNCMTMLSRLLFGYTSEDLPPSYYRVPTVDPTCMWVAVEPKVKPTLAHIPGLQTPVIDCDHILPDPTYVGPEKSFTDDVLEPEGFDDFSDLCLN